MFVEITELSKHDLGELVGEGRKGKRKAGEEEEEKLRGQLEKAAKKPAWGRVRKEVAET